MGLGNRSDQTWCHNLLSRLTSQQVVKTKLITITMHSLECDTFLKTAWEETNNFKVNFLHFCTGSGSTRNFFSILAKSKHQLQVCIGHENLSLTNWIIYRFIVDRWINQPKGIIQHRNPWQIDQSSKALWPV